MAIVAEQGIGFMGSLRRLNELAPAAQRAETVSMFYRQQEPRRHQQGSQDPDDYWRERGRAPR